MVILLKINFQRDSIPILVSCNVKLEVQTGLDLVTSPDKKKSGFGVHTIPDSYRIQKFALWRADSKSCGSVCRIHRKRVDGSRIPKEKVADSKKDQIRVDGASEYLWKASPRHVALGIPRPFLVQLLRIMKWYSIDAVLLTFSLPLIFITLHS